MVELRIVMTSTSTHSGTAFHYKANSHILGVGVLSGHHHQFLLPTIGTILPVINLHGQQKALWKSRSVDISHWRQ